MILKRKMFWVLSIVLLSIGGIASAYQSRIGLLYWGLHVAGRIDEEDRLYLVGLNNLTGGNSRAGIRNLQKLVNKYPKTKWKEAYTSLATALLDANQQQAIDVLRVGLDQNPGDLAILDMLYTLYISESKLKEARELIEGNKKHHQNNLGYLEFRIAKTYLYEEQYNLALDLFKGLLDQADLSYADDHGSYEFAALCLYKLDRLTEMRELLRVGLGKGERIRKQLVESSFPFIREAILQNG